MTQDVRAFPAAFTDELPDLLPDFVQGLHLPRRFRNDAGRSYHTVPVLRCAASVTRAGVRLV